MKCPDCGSEQSQKNGHRQGRQNYRCKDCGRQFIASYLQRGYSDDAKRICQRMHRSGLTLREIERLTGISHSTVYSWIKQHGRLANPRLNPPAEPTEPNRSEADRSEPDGSNSGP